MRKKYVEFINAGAKREFGKKYDPIERIIMTLKELGYPVKTVEHDRRMNSYIFGTDTFIFVVINKDNSVYEINMYSPNTDTKIKWTGGRFEPGYRSKIETLILKVKRTIENSDVLVSVDIGYSRPFSFLVYDKTNKFFRYIQTGRPLFRILDDIIKYFNENIYNIDMNELIRMYYRKSIKILPPYYGLINYTFKTYIEPIIKNRRCVFLVGHTNHEVSMRVLRYYLASHQYDDAIEYFNNDVKYVPITLLNERIVRRFLRYKNIPFIMISEDNSTCMLFDKYKIRRDENVFKGAYINVNNKKIFVIRDLCSCLNIIYKVDRGVMDEFEKSVIYEGKFSFSGETISVHIKNPKFYTEYCKDIRDVIETHKKYLEKRLREG